MTSNALPHILVIFDDPEAAQSVVPIATHLAAGLQARVTLLRVVPAPKVVSRDLPHDLLPPGVLAERQAYAELRRLESRFAGRSVASQVVMGDNPSAEIIGWLRRHPADLVVVGTRRSTGLRRLFQRDAAEAVQRSGLAPIIVTDHRTEPTTPWSPRVASPAA